METHFTEVETGWKMLGCLTEVVQWKSKFKDYISLYSVNTDMCSHIPFQIQESITKSDKG